MKIKPILFLMIFTLSSCSSQRKPFMIVGEHNYIDSSGFSLYGNGSIGTVNFKRAKGLNLEYKNLDIFSAKAGAAAGTRFNRFSFGVSYLKGFQELYKEEKIDSESKNKRIVSFQSLSDELEFWLSHTFVINPDWSSHEIFLSYLPINKIKYKNVPKVGVVSFDQKLFIFGYSYSFLSFSISIASFFEGIDFEGPSLDNIGFGLKFSTSIHPVRAFLNYEVSNFEDNLITETFLFGMSFFF